MHWDQIRYPHNCWRSVACCGAWLAVVGWLAAPLPAQLQDNARIDGSIVKLLRAHCFDCHDADEPEAGLDLTHFQTVGSIRRDAALWKQLAQRVASGNMPPAEFGEMSDSDRAQLGAWVQTVLTELDCAEFRAPGTVTIRRLNRRAYRHAILDTLGVDYQPADDFPGDDVGYGFDNIGDVLSLPPLLMEKYLAAAEAISRQVIVAPEDLAPVEVPLANNQWRLGQGVNSHDGRLNFFSNGTAEFDYDATRSQDVTLRIRAVGQQAGGEPVRFALAVDRKQIRQFEIASHEEVETFDVTLRLLKGRRKLRLSFENDFYNPNAENRADRDRNLIVHSVQLVIQPAATREPSAVEARFLFVRPSGEQQAREAARQLIGSWASCFYRRVATPAEVERILAIYDDERRDGGSFERGMQYALQAMLVSPHFLYQVEAPCPADGTPRDLSSFELATSLAFFLWNGPPDGALLRVAHREDLQQDDVLRRELQRLMGDDRVDRMIEDFVGQWLHLRLLDRFEPDTTRFPDADADLLRAMQQETVLLCRDVFRRDASVVELLDARYSFINSRLAAHYGMQLPEGPSDAFVRVEWPTEQRGGLITQGSMLTLTSNPTRTSPVKRGRWILDNLLGEPPPPPPADAEPLEEQELVGTLREKMEQHRRNPSCATCHEQMDGLGFALENFDAVGRWREADDDVPIDASGELPGGLEFRGPAELRQLLLTVKREQYVRCFVEKLMTYALGRGLTYRDQCAVTEIVRASAASDYRFSDVVTGIVTSRPFRQRQGKMED